MKDILKDIFDNFNSRLKNPLLFAFVISFVVYNWSKVLILLFGNNKIEEKLIQLTEGSSHFNWLIPILTAIVYVTVFPYLLLLIEYSQKQKGKWHNKLIDDRIESKKTINEKIARYNRTVADIKAGTSQINELNAKNDSLQLRLNSLTDENIKLQELLKVKENTMSKYEMKITEYQDKIMDNIAMRTYENFQKDPLSDVYFSVITDVENNNSISKKYDPSIIKNLIFNDIIATNLIHGDLQPEKYFLTDFGKKLSKIIERRRKL